MDTERSITLRQYPCFFAVIIGVIVLATVTSASPPDPEAGRRAQELEDLEVLEHLGDTLPLDLEFTDSQGRIVQLGDYFQNGRPVVLNLGYYQCPMLCGLVLDGLVHSASKINWTPGSEYDLITVSINPSETAELAAAKKRGVMNYLDRADAETGWHFLVGNAHNTAALAEAAGFGYRWVESQQQYAHAAVLMVLTPEGSLSRYLYYGNSPDGEAFAPQTLRLSLVEASDGRVGSSLDHVLLWCYQWDANRGDYSLVARNLMRLGGAMTVAILGLVIGLMLFRERRRKHYGTIERPPYAPPENAQNSAIGENLTRTAED